MCHGLFVIELSRVTHAHVLLRTTIFYGNTLHCWSLGLVWEVAPCSRQHMAAATSQGFGQDELITSFGVRADPWPWNFRGSAGSIHNFLDESTVGKEVCSSSTNDIETVVYILCISLYHFLPHWNTLGWLWVTSASVRSVRSARLIQRTGARSGTCFVGTCSESFVYSPRWEQGYFFSGSFLFWGFSASQNWGLAKLKQGKSSIFLVAGFHFPANSCARLRFCKCPLTVLVFHSFTTWGRHYMSRKHFKLKIDRNWKLYKNYQT